MRSSEIREWAEMVIHQLRQISNLDKDEIIFLAGKKYRKYLLPHISDYKILLKGLGIGKQLKYLKNRTQNE